MRVARARLWALAGRRGPRSAVEARFRREGEVDIDGRVARRDENQMESARSSKALDS